MDLQVQYHHRMQAKWGSTRGTAAERRQKEVYAADHRAHEDYTFLLADLEMEFPSSTPNQLHSKAEKKLWQNGFHSLRPKRTWWVAKKSL